MKQLLTLVLFLCVAGAHSQRLTTVTGTYSSITYVPAREELYALRPASADDGNTLCQIDRRSGEVLACYFVGNDPNLVVATTSGRYLYLGFRGEARVRRFDLGSKQIDQDFLLEGVDYAGGPLYAEDILPLRGSDNTVAISLRNDCCSPRHAGVALYRNGQLQGTATDDPTGSNYLAYTDVDDVLIGYNNETDLALRRMQLGRQGVEVTDVYYGFESYGARLEYSEGRIYVSGGQTASLLGGVATVTGSVDLSGFQYYGSLAVEAVPAVDRLYYLGFDNNAEVTLIEADIVTLAVLGATPVGFVTDPYDYGGPGGRELVNLAAPNEFAFLLPNGRMGLFSYCSPAVTTVPPPYAGSTVICFEQSLQLIAPVGVLAGDQTILWSNGLMGDTIGVQEEGYYTYRIVDATGCPSPKSEPFYVGKEYGRSGAPEIYSPLSNVLCVNSTLTLRSGYYTPLLWSTGAVADEITVSEAGSYTAQYIEPGTGCPSEVSAPVVITASAEVAPDAPTVLPGLDIDTCTNQPVTLTAQSAAARFFWTFGGYDAGDNSSSDFRVYPDYEPRPFSVVARSASGCVSPPARGTITFYPLPDPPIIQYNNATGTLAASVDGPLLWYYQDEFEAETRGRFYRPKRRGFYSARKRGDQCLSDASALVSVEVTTGTRDEAISRQLHVFPNPVSDRINLTFDRELMSALGTGPLAYRLTNAAGQQVASGTLDHRAPGAGIAVDGLSSGVYLLTFATSGRAVLRKRITVAR